MAAHPTMEPPHRASPLNRLLSSPSLQRPPAPVPQSGPRCRNAVDEVRKNRMSPRLPLAKHAKKIEPDARLSLGDLCVFAQDIILVVIETYIVPSGLSGNVLQLLRVSNTGYSVSAERSRRFFMRGGPAERGAEFLAEVEFEGAIVSGYFCARSWRGCRPGGAMHWPDSRGAGARP